MKTDIYVTPASGLHLNVTDTDNRLDYNLAMDVIDFFKLNKTTATNIKI